MNTNRTSSWWRTPRFSLLSLLILIFAFTLILGPSAAFASDTKSKPAPVLTDTDVGKIADAIYTIEGGKNAKVPYGILSVKVKDETEARRVCENTIRNNYQRWLKSHTHTHYVDFLADRYCPATADPKGNTNWKRNIRAHLTAEYVQRFVKANG